MFLCYWLHLEITSSIANLSFLLTTVTEFTYLTNKAEEGHTSLLPFSKGGETYHNILMLRLTFNAYFWKHLLLHHMGSPIQLFSKSVQFSPLQT